MTQELELAYQDAYLRVIAATAMIDEWIYDLPAPESDGMDWTHVGEMNRIAAALEAVAPASEPEPEPEGINPAALYWASFNRMELRIPGQAVTECSAPGDAMPACEYWAPRIQAIAYKDAFPNGPSPDKIRAELREYGAWSDDELADDDANWTRLVWVACGNIAESDSPDCSPPVNAETHAVYTRDGEPGATITPMDEPPGDGWTLHDTGSADHCWTVWWSIVGDSDTAIDASGHVATA